MNREEAIEHLMHDWRINPDGEFSLKPGRLDDFLGAMTKALYALDGPTREMVERMRGEWVKKDGYTECSKCEYWYDSAESEDDGDRSSFCPSCGAPMTDEAVEMMLERVEAVKDV